MNNSITEDVIDSGVSYLRDTPGARNVLWAVRTRPEKRKKVTRAQLARALGWENYDLAKQVQAISGIKKPYLEVDGVNQHMRYENRVQMTQIGFRLTQKMGRNGEKLGTLDPINWNTDINENAKIAEIVLYLQRSRNAGALLAIIPDDGEGVSRYDLARQYREGRHGSITNYFPHLKQIGAVRVSDDDYIFRTNEATEALGIFRRIVSNK